MNVKYKRGPNGGWGWYVLLGAFCNHLILDGILYSSGLFLIHFIEEFDAGLTIASMTITSMLGLSLVIGPVAAALINAWGCRLVGITGSILAAMGLLATSFASNIYIVLITFGIVAGTGLGLMNVATVIILPLYFSTKLARVSGISAAGSGVGTICFAPMVEHLIQSMGWRHTCTVLSGLTLTCIGFTWLYTPLLLKRVPFGTISGNNQNDKNNENYNDENKSTMVPVTRSSEQVEEEEQFYETNAITTCQVVKQSFKEMTGPEVYEDFNFIVFSTSSFFFYIGYLVPYVYTKSRVLELNIASHTQASYLIGIIGVGGTIGRLAYGYLASVKCVNTLTLYMVSTILAGIITCLSVFIRSYWLFAVYCALFGLLTGGGIALTPVLVTDLFRLDRVSNMYGLVTLVEGIATLLPISGSIFEKTHSLIGTFLSAGAFIIAGGIILVLIPIHNRNIKK